MSFRPKQGYTASLLRITSLAEIPAQLRVEKVREGKGHGGGGVGLGSGLLTPRALGNLVNGLLMSGRDLLRYEVDFSVLPWTGCSPII